MAMTRRPITTAYWIAIRIGARREQEGKYRNGDLLTEMAQAATCARNRDPTAGRDVDAVKALVDCQTLERIPFIRQVRGTLGESMKYSQRRGWTSRLHYQATRG